MFNQNLEGTFKMYSTSHLIAVLVVFIAVFLVFHFRDTLRTEKFYKKFRYILIGVTIGQELSLNIYRVIMGEWTLDNSLPFHLCGLAMIITSFILLTESKKIFTSTFFILMIGATLAILTPAVEKELGFPHYRFLQFFLGHGMIMVNFTFMLFVMEFHKEVKYIHLLHNFGTVIVLAAFNLIVNVITGGNYMYLMGKPGEGTAFDLFGEHPWYLLNIFIFGIPLFFHLFYLPFFIRNKRNKKILRTS